MNASRLGWTLLVLLNLTLVSMLGFFDRAALPRAEGQIPSAPFVNAAEVQLEVVQQLKTLNALVKEQNALLRSGQLRVVVDSKPAPAGKSR